MSTPKLTKNVITLVDKQTLYSTVRIWNSPHHSKKKKKLITLKPCNRNNNIAGLSSGRKKMETNQGRLKRLLSKSDVYNNNTGRETFLLSLLPQPSNVYDGHFHSDFFSSHRHFPSFCSFSLFSYIFLTHTQLSSYFPPLFL